MSSCKSVNHSAEEFNTNSNQNTPKTLTKKLTEEEYKKQGEEYTKKALEELNKNVQENKYLFKPIKLNKSKNSNNHLSSDDYSDDDSDNSELEEIDKDNLLISNAKIIQKQLNSSSNSKKRVRTDFGSNNQNDLYQLVVAQRELELQKNMKLNNLNKELQCEVDKLENEIYYLKLDLSNKTVDYDNLKSQYEKEKQDNKIKLLDVKTKLKNEANKSFFLDLMNMVFIFMLVMSLSYNLKYYMFS